MDTVTTEGPLTQAVLLRAATRFLDGFRDWVNGTVPDDDATFEDFWDGGVDPDITLVMPSGATIRGTDARDTIRESHGANPAFRYELSEVRSVLVSNDVGILLAHEWQHNSETGTRLNNGRITTAVLHRDERGLVRLHHVHQTWLPDEIVKARVRSR